MPLNEDQIIWTGKTVGLTLESYNDKYSIKSVRKFIHKGQDQLGYDWSFPQEYDKESKKWKPKDKAMPTSVYLGTRDEAIDSLKSLLKQLSPSEEIPF